MTDDIYSMSQKLEQLGYTTVLSSGIDNNIILFYIKNNTAAEITYAISQSKTDMDLYIGNLMIVSKKNVVLAYNSEIRAEDYTFEKLLESIKNIKRNVDQNYSLNYMDDKMALQEKFYNVNEVIRKIIATNHYTPLKYGSQGDD